MPRVFEFAADAASHGVEASALAAMAVAPSTPKTCPARPLFRDVLRMA